MFKKLFSVNDDINNSNLSDGLKKSYTKFCYFLNNNGFSIISEDDGNGWKIVYLNKCVSHMNFINVGIWIDTCEFGDKDAVNDILKNVTWAHVRVCEHFNSNGKKCGCGNQLGFNRTIFGRDFNNICFSIIEFINPDVEAMENIKLLMLLFIQNIPLSST